MHEDDVQDDRPSKSERKRQSDELQSLGEALIELPASELEALPLPDNLRDAIELARRITAHGGLYRQKQYIGKLMRKIDAEPIRAALAERRNRERVAALQFRRVEHWRDRLLAEGPETLAALATEAKAPMDAAMLTKLIERARAERTTQQAPHAARELFRVLRDILGTAAPGT